MAYAQCARSGENADGPPTDTCDRVGPLDSNALEAIRLSVEGRQRVRRDRRDCRPDGPPKRAASSRESGSPCRAAPKGRKPPAVQHWRGQRASVLGLLDKVSSINHRRLNRFEHSTKQRSLSLRVRGDRRAERDQTARAHSRVKTSDRVRGAHEQPATSLTYPNNCLQQFVHHGLRLRPSARELAMSSTSSMKITACSSESNSSKALCSSSAIIASPSAPSFDGRISTNGQPNRRRLLRK